MNLNDAMWHIDNFVNTWNGWYHLLNGLAGVFDNVTRAINSAINVGGTDGIGAFFSGLSSTRGEGIGAENWAL